MSEHEGQLSLFSTATDEAPAAGVEASVVTQTSDDVEAADDRPDELDVVDLERRLEARLGRPIASVTLTRNRSRIVSGRPSPKGIEVRIHRCFAGADDRVIDAVAAFLALRGDPRRRRALAVIREHFRTHGQDDTARVPTLRPEGRVYDLRALRDRVNARYFDGTLDVEITWGRAPARLPSKRRGSFNIRLGSYHDGDRLIRIHPVLDRDDVPEFVVESVVHHEMVHAAVPPEPPGPNGRRRVHTREFRRLEKRYAHYAEAEAWLDEHLGRLDRLRRSRRWF
ncbi:MAG: hypothetical protein AAGE94_23370 [Acidobacteriota bacterium]